MTSTPDPVHGLHPDCPDARKLGPNRTEARLRAAAARVEHDTQRRDTLWEKGFTRRRALAGAGMVGVAAMGAQLVTTRVSFGDPMAKGTVVVVFLRGGMDGLSVLVPANDAHLKQLRPNIGVPAGALLPMTRGFGLHPALAPLQKYWKAGTFSAVPALSTPDLSRSHFQAQDCLERGGSSTSAAASGWLDRVLAQLGPGTTFRAVGEASTLPRSLVGSHGELALRGIDAFTLSGWDGVHDQTIKALGTLYTGFDHPLAGQAKNTLTALATAEKLSATKYAAAAKYPGDEFSKSLSDIARLIKSNVGLRVACVDLGGWDMHTNLGTVGKGDMNQMLTQLGAALDAFATDLATDLGSALQDTTLVTMTEFGRRVEENGNTGLDHGHGSVALLLGGGIKSQTIAGDWAGLAPDALDNGDVPGTNDYRDLLGEIVTKRLGVGASGLSTIFPGHSYHSMGALR